MFFSQGEKVLCIEDKNNRPVIQKDHVYTISDVKEFGVFLEEIHHDIYFFPHYFMKMSEYRKSNINYILDKY
jgi:hypothetical protein